jgi:hypothetical protein
VRLQSILAFALLIGSSGYPSRNAEISKTQTDTVQDGSRRQQLSDATVALLEQADQFELLVLSPKPIRAENAFHGYKVLGAAKIAQPDTRRRLISALMQSMRESDGTVAQCFNPRHGIRATRHGKRADLVICFECLSFRLYGDSQGAFEITHTPEVLFEEVLKKNGISPLGPS